MSAGAQLPDEETHRSPPLGIVAIVFIALFLASLVTVFGMTGIAHFPTPDDPIEQIQAYYTRFADVMRIVGFLQFGASIPLGLFSVSIVSRLQFLRVNVAGVYIALLSMLTGHLYPLLPLSHFLTVLWLLVAGFSMPKRRSRHS